LLVHEFLDRLASPLDDGGNVVLELDSLMGSIFRRLLLAHGSAFSTGRASLDAHLAHADRKLVR
jgi:hypothetical protein